jgi:hypothetical protein
MSQSTVTVGALILAFIIYTTMKGNLGRYMKVMGLA